MTPNELRIGNWVTRIATGEPARVTGLYLDKDVFIDLPGQNKYYRISNKSASPIPVTPEILKKAGFELQTGFAEGIGEYTWWDKLDHIDFEINCTLDKWFVIGKDYKYFKYLHQLQNLYFALTREELEINL